MKVSQVLLWKKWISQNVKVTPCFFFILFCKWQLLMLILSKYMYLLQEDENQRCRLNVIKIMILLLLIKKTHNTRVSFLFVGDERKEYQKITHWRSGHRQTDNAYVWIRWRLYKTNPKFEPFSCLIYVAYI